MAERSPEPEVVEKPELLVTDVNDIPQVSLWKGGSLPTRVSCLINCSMQIVAGVKAFFATHKTKDVSFRKQQLRNVMKFIEENKERILKALFTDLRKVWTPPVQSDLAAVPVVRVTVLATQPVPPDHRQ